MGDESASGADWQFESLSVSESATYSGEDTTADKRNRKSMNSQVPAYRAKHGATVKSKYGLKVGDIIKARKVEPLKNPPYKDTRPEDTFQSRHGDWFLEKKNWSYLVAGFAGQDLTVHLMTTFSDTDLEILRSTSIVDVSGGARKRLADFMQISADHHPDNPVAHEPLCYNYGEIQLHWKGHCAAPPNKFGYVSLAAPDNLVLNQWENVPQRVAMTSYAWKTASKTNNTAGLARNASVNMMKSIQRSPF